MAGQPTESSRPVRAISVTHIQVSSGRMTLQVPVAPGFPKYTTPELMEHVRQAYPTLPHHACVNECGPRFSFVMNDTSIPHVLEHLIIDIQVRSLRPHQKRLLMGTTEWLDEAAGTAVIDVAFADDLCAMAALKEALDFLNAVLTSQNCR